MYNTVPDVVLKWLSWGVFFLAIAVWIGILYALRSNSRHKD